MKEKNTYVLIALFAIIVIVNIIIIASPYPLNMTANTSTELLQQVSHKLDVVFSLLCLNISILTGLVISFLLICPSSVKTKK